MGVPRILHYPGSKWNLAEWIIEHMPPHSTYLEPFFGSGAVLFSKAPSTLETINDLDGDVVNLFRIIREHPEELSQLLKWTPYARSEYDDAHHLAENEIESARRMLVRCWQSIRVKTGSKSGWKCRGTPDDSYRIKQWNGLPDSIVKVAERLKDVQIENRPAIQLLARYRRPDVLVYADPPYVLSARNGKMYSNEMDDGEHAELLEGLDKHPGPVLLSGYENKLYDDRLQHWMRETRVVMTDLCKERTEVLWINPIAAETVSRQLTIFD